MNVAEIFNEAFWYAAPILMVASTTVTGVINQLFKVADKFKQLISWAVGIALSCTAIAVGFLGDNNGWPSYIAMSVVVGLSSNGIYDIDFIHEWIDKWFTKPVRK